jgi:carbon-monoxide dehydrogenase medium subunit
MGSTPLRLTPAEEHLVGVAVDDVDPAAAGERAAAGLDPPDDIHASGTYRRRIGAALVARALARAISEAQGGTAHRG